MSETLTHGATLARQFYDEHHSLFATAIAATTIADKYFTISATDFDDWLVAQSILAQPASAFDSNTIHRRGAVMRRNETRGRINSAALRAENFPAYTIGPAKNNNLKVRLIMLYAKEAPDEIAHRIRVSTKHHERVVLTAIKVMQRSQMVRDEDRVGMVGFARMMVPMLRGLSEGLVDIMRGVEQPKRRKHRP